MRQIATKCCQYSLALELIQTLTRDLYYFLFVINNEFLFIGLTLLPWLPKTTLKLVCFESKLNVVRLFLSLYKQQA